MSTQKQRNREFTYDVQLKWDNIKDRFVLSSINEDMTSGKYINRIINDEYMYKHKYSRTVLEIQLKYE